MMTIPLLVISISAGILAGGLAGLVTKGRGFGLPGNIIVAILGAILAVYLLDTLGITFANEPPAIFIASFLSAILVLAFIGWMRR